MCAGLCPTYWITFGIAEQNINDSCPQHEWDPPIFWVFNSPSPAPPPQGPMDHTGGGGTSADIVPTQIIFGVDPCKRCWDIDQKPPKCKNSPSTPIVKFHLPLFPPAGGRQPAKGEKTHPEPEYARVRTLAWIGPRVVEKSLTEQKNTVKLIPRPSL